jgi:hypothetical protein
MCDRNVTVESQGNDLTVQVVLNDLPENRIGGIQIGLEPGLTERNASRFTAEPLSDLQVRELAGFVLLFGHGISFLIMSTKWPMLDINTATAITDVKPNGTLHQVVKMFHG